MITLHKDETLEDLQLNGRRMIQSRSGFRFGEDSVILANYVASFYQQTFRAERKLIDLGCNSGSISLILSGKLPHAHITGVEIDPGAHNRFVRNIALNKLGASISPILDDWNHLSHHFPEAFFDGVVSNPPYCKVTIGQEKILTEKNIAREEIFSSMDQLFHITSYLLKRNCYCFFIYRSQRMVDVIDSMRRNRLEPRRICMITPYNDTAPTAFIAVGQKDVKSGGFVLERPLVIFKEKGVYTDQIREMYGSQQTLPENELYHGVFIESGATNDLMK